MNLPLLKVTAMVLNGRVVPIAPGFVARAPTPSLNLVVARHFGIAFETRAANDR